MLENPLGHFRHPGCQFGQWVESPFELLSGVQDRELLRRFEKVDTLSDQEKNLAKEILDLVIIKHRFRELTGPKAATG